MLIMCTLPFALIGATLVPSIMLRNRWTRSRGYRQSLAGAP
jgi:hypothetical protein